MGRKRIYQNEAERRQTQNERRKLARAVIPVEKRIPLSFIGVDGEGIGKGEDHRYILLGIGKEQIENPHGLQLQNIFSFLWAQFQRKPEFVYAGFYLGYDFTQWLKQLPAKTAWMLFTDKGQKLRARTKSGGNPVPFPVRWEGWEFDILAMKRFKLRPEGEKSWLYVCDAGSFFQTSFLKAIDPSKWSDPVVTQEEYEIVKQGKMARSSARLDNDMRRYNILENEILSRILQRLSHGFEKMGIRLDRDQWFGPGQGAQEWLKKQQNVPSAEDLGKIIPVWKSGNVTITEDNKNGSMTSAIGRLILQPSIKIILDTGRLAYYGGWFEIFAHGHIPGRTWEYDINSAYPYIASKLPCLRHGKWTYRNSSQAPALCRGNIRIVHASVKGTDRHIGAMLHRHSDGKITRPHQTGGYYWQHELEAAIMAGLIDEIEIKESWTYEPCNCNPPLSGLDQLYDIRLAAGKNTPVGKGAKLVYNSVYGKFAQSVGNPRYGNSIYASLITAGCRTMILNAIALAGPGECVMVATDAVFFRHPVNLPLSDKLGEWSVKEHDNLTLFKPGIYWDDTTRYQIRLGKSPVFKARGINAEQFAQSITIADNHFSRWRKEYPGERNPDKPREGWFPRITFTSGFSMITCLQALQRRKWFLAGTISDQELTQDADPIAKRHSGWYDPVNGIYWSTPYERWPEEESTSYDKTFGQGDVPQPEDYGIHPDGWVLNLWKEGLNPHA